MQASVPTPFTHAVIGLAAAELIGETRPAKTRLRILSVACATVPDLDALGFAFGVRYADLLGHRGLSHSLTLAVVAGLIVAAFGFTGSGARPRRLVTLATYFTALTISHGLLDAMTNGGLGIAFFSPLDPSRYFLPWRPIVVAPLSIAGLFTQRGGRMLVSEIAIVWLPMLMAVALAVGLRRMRQAREQLARAAEWVAGEHPDEGEDLDEESSILADD